MFRSRKYTVLDSFRFVQKIPATPSSEGILLLDDKILSEIEGHRQRLEMQQKKLKEAEEKEKNEKIERMKQGPAENMIVAVLKQLLKDKGIAFSSKAKKSDLVKIFNTQACTRHNNVTLSWLHVKRAPTVEMLAAVTVHNVTAYDGCFLSRSSFTLLTNIHRTKSITT